MAIRIWDGDTDGEPTTSANWSSDTEPSTGDTAIFPAYDTTTDTILGNATWPSTGTVAKVVIENGGSKTIGTRALPLTMLLVDSTASILEIGGTGTYFLSPKDYEIITITEAGAAPGTGEYALNLTAMASTDGTPNHVIDVLCEDGMSIGIGAENETVTIVDTINVAGGDVTVGAGCTKHGGGAVDLTISGGTVITHCAVGTVTQTGGIWQHMAGAAATLNIDDGTCYYRSNGEATTVNIGEKGTVDASEDNTSRTFANVDMWAGATLNDPRGTITFTAYIDLNKCGVADVTIDVGTNYTFRKDAI